MRRRRDLDRSWRRLSLEARPAPFLLAALLAWGAAPVPAQAAAAGPQATQPPLAPTQALPYYLADRGPGIPMSQFGTFVEPGEFLVYPFYEYTRTPVFEYHPSELGSVGGKDFNGKLFEREALLYFAYGISERLAFELEGALRCGRRRPSRRRRTTRATCPPASRSRGWATSRGSSAGAGARRRSRGPSSTATSRSSSPCSATRC